MIKYNRVIINPDGSIYYGKNLKTHNNDNNDNNDNNENNDNDNNENNDNDNNDNVRINFIENQENINFNIQINDLNLNLSLTKFIVMIDILSNFHEYNFNIFFCYIDLIIDLIGFFAASIFNKELFKIYLIKCEIIIFINILKLINCNSVLIEEYLNKNNYNYTTNFINNTLNYTNYTDLSFLNNLLKNNQTCLHINLITGLNILTLIFLKRFYYNLNHYRYIFENYNLYM